MRTAIPLLIISMISLSGCDSVERYLENRTALDRDKYEFEKVHKLSDLESNRYSMHTGAKWFAPMILDNKTGALYRVYRNMEGDKATDEGIKPMPYTYGEIIAYTPEDFWNEVEEIKRLDKISKKLIENADRLNKDTSSKAKN